MPDVRELIQNFFSNANMTARADLYGMATSA